MARRVAITWAFNVVALFVATWLLSGLSYGSDWWALFAAAFVFTLANVFLRPVLAVLSIPLILATLGLFYLLINVLMLYLTHWIVPQFTIASFWWALLAAVIVGVVNGVLALAFGRPGRHGVRAAVWLHRYRRRARNRDRDRRRWAA
ncbi:MAG TPA: phage holin family protein [Solirubrobacteraceae bacterium]|nr:phage holin family protein [Solirubrobacteraceae bacterium]